MTGDDLYAFLWYGYLPRFRALPTAVVAAGSECDRSEDSRPLSELVKTGLLAWKRAIELCLAQNTEGIVIPLSGGLDSRAILAGLLEHVSPARLHTYTFGVPGSCDFDIGNLTATVAGTRHRTFSLNDYAYSADHLLDISKRTGGETALFHHAPIAFVEAEYGSAMAHWSGFMGDPLSGSHLLAEDSETWERAKRRFAGRNRYCRSVEMPPPGFDAAERLPAAPFIEPGLLCYDEQLDFAVRQACYIKPLVLLDGYEYRTPFLRPEWVRFILSVPRRYRQGQHLYKEILKTAYPKLFSLPVKNNFGLPLAAPRWRRTLRRQQLRLRAAAKRFLPWVDWGISPGINYIDFDRGLRERADLKAVVYESIQDLKKRRIVDWIDIDAIWERHQKRRSNHADALTLLASLEINLKAREMKPK